MNSRIEAYWQAFLATLPPDHRPQRYQAWGFGDSPEMADELGALAAAGVKTATASLLWEQEADPDDTPPIIGGYSVILDGRDEPLCIIQTMELRIIPFNTVDAEFAHDEGEGDRSLAFWRAAHWRFFSRRCAEIGRAPSETMPVICERFRAVFR
jgi:uncharacterized protein YhfF